MVKQRMEKENDGLQQTLKTLKTQAKLLQNQHNVNHSKIIYRPLSTISLAAELKQQMNSFKSNRETSDKLDFHHYFYSFNESITQLN